MSSLRPFPLSLLLLGLFTGIGHAQTELITVTPSGPSDGGAIYAELSRDGRMVSFQAGASNLVPGDTNGVADIFVRDMELGVTTRLSVSDGGLQADGDCLDPVISLDGGHVTWFAYATNLVPGDTNGSSDVFVHDLAAGSTVRVPESFQLEGISRYPVISAGGRFVAFESTAENAVPGDTNGTRDIFVYDFADGSLVRASVSATGAQASGTSLDASISGDGRYVAFESDAPDLVPGDTNGASDVFIKDLLTGAIELVSRDSAGLQGNAGSFDPFLSEDGTVICFSSRATNLIEGDTNGYQDIFVRDLSTGITVRVNETWNGMEPHVGAYEGALSPDGGHVAFFSFASNLVPGDNNSALDIFVHDLGCRMTQRVSIGQGGLQADESSFYPAISEGGRYVVFDSFASNLVEGDTNGTRDAFRHDRSETYTTFCLGDDSTGLSCPCGDLGGTGEGCANSTGEGARLLPSGSTSVSQDSLRFTADGLVPGAPALLFQGDGLLGNGQGVFLGAGRHCVGGSVRRLGVSVPAPSGLASWGPGLAVPGAWQPGQVLGFQVWYRDPGAPCGGFNLSQAIQVCFQP